MPEPAHPKNHYDSLKREVDGYIKYSHTWSIVWANVYYLLRVTLIVLAACVAAKDSLPRIASIAAVLSLLVAVGTALDTWPKTGNRYRGHYTFNDKFIALYTDLELTDATDTEKVNNLELEFKKMISDYSVAVLPE
jgi:peptidoglycan/LPS O-acetylase OafA/YrhL